MLDLKIIAENIDIVFGSKKEDPMELMSIGIGKMDLRNETVINEFDIEENLLKVFFSNTFLFYSPPLLSYSKI